MPSIFRMPTLKATEVAGLIRVDLATKFPGAKFSVTAPDRHLENIRVEYTDGPPKVEVYKATGVYVLNMENPQMFTFKGKEGISPYSHINVYRHYSYALICYLMQDIAEQHELTQIPIILNKDGRGILQGKDDAVIEGIGLKISELITTRLSELDARTIPAEALTLAVLAQQGQRTDVTCLCGKKEDHTAMQKIFDTWFCKVCVSKDIQDLRAFDCWPPEDNAEKPLFLSEEELLKAQEADPNEPGADELPVYTRDRVSRIHWLDFRGEWLDDATAHALFEAGWRYGRYRKQWYNNERYAKVPLQVRYVNGGQCEYSAERAERLEGYSENARERADGHAERSHHIMIEKGPPVDQPVVRGTRAGNRFAKAVESSDRAMRQARKEDQKAQWLQWRAEGSEARHRNYEHPLVIARRIQRLADDITSLKNQRARDLLYFGTPAIKEAREKGDLAEVERLELEHLKGRERHEEMLARLWQDKLEAEDDLKAVGGLPTQDLEVQKGDLIEMNTWGFVEVLRVNEKTFTVAPYKPFTPRNQLWWKKRTAPKIDLRRIIRHEGEPDPDLATLREPIAPPTAQPQEEQKDRTLPSEGITTLDIGRNTRAFYFTSGELAIQTCSEDAALDSLPLPKDVKYMIEPSAGTGALAKAMRAAYPEATLHCVEIEWQFQKYLREQGYTVFHEDFLDFAKQTLHRYHFAAFNPPFLDLTWLDHFEALWSIMAPGGLIRGILPAPALTRKEKRVQQFREMLEEHGSYITLPAGSFLEAGTNCPVILLSMKKPD